MRKYPYNYLKLYLVLEPTLCGGIEPMIETAKIALDNGITAIQLRFEEETDKGEWYQAGLALQKIMKDTDIPLIINDHVDVALAIDADGVHVGQTDLPPAVVRKLIGTEKYLGVSVGTVEEVEAIETSIVDYIGIGPIYPTTTKQDATSALEVEMLQTLIELKKLPAVAIGGINADNLQQVLSTGIEGVAVVSAICGQKNIAASTQRLRSLIEER